MKKTIYYYLSPLLLSSFLVPIFAHAAEDATTTSSTTTPVVVMTKAQLFTSCSQDAIELRDTKLAQSRATYNTGMNAILIERKNREKAAVAIEDEKEKRGAIKDSIEEYKSQVKSIQGTLTQSRKTIWSNFEGDTKKCRDYLDEDVQVAKEEKKIAKDSTKKETIDTKEIKKDDTVVEKSAKESFFDSIKSLFGKE